MGGNTGKTKDIRRAVEAELAFDPLVDATNITTKDTNGGGKALKGRRNELMFAIRVRPVAPDHNIRPDRPPPTRAAR